MKKSTAIVITGGYLDTDNAKTAHGLIRGTDRFQLVGIIDHKFPGKDAGELLDGKHRQIPVYASIADFMKSGTAEYCVIGVATKGGIIPDSLREMLMEALHHGLNLVNGLHDYVSEHAELVSLAKSKGLQIIDVRKPKKFKDLHFWKGKIKEVKCVKVAVQNKKKPVQRKKFHYKFDGQNIYILDKKSHLIVGGFVVETLTTDALVYYSEGKECEKTTLVRVK